MAEAGEVREIEGYEKQALFHAIGTIMANGFALRTRDVAEIMPYYGYSPGGGSAVANNMLGGHALRKSIEHTGVIVSSVRYSNTRIYYDGRLSLEEAGIDRVKKEIDEGRRRPYRQPPRPRDDLVLQTDATELDII